MEELRRSEKLAELIGIMLGDGGITKYQIAVTLNSRDEAAYVKFVRMLIQDLFSVTPAIYYRPRFSAANIVVSSRELVLFCHEKLGLKIGNKVKQGANVPAWIVQNKHFSIACMRGLFDTDGSIFSHRYYVNNKCYSYKKMEFCSLSRPLLRSAHRILKNLGMHPRIARNKSVWLDSVADVRNYFSVVGSHNQKHLNRYAN